MSLAVRIRHGGAWSRPVSWKAIQPMAAIRAQILTVGAPPECTAALEWQITFVVLLDHRLLCFAGTMRSARAISLVTLLLCYILGLIVWNYRDQIWSTLTAPSPIGARRR
jgi:hypothetical protein